MMNMPTTYLDRIITAHRAAARADDRVEAELMARAFDQAPPRGFVRAIRESRSDGAIAVIAEIKRRSPSKGALAVDLDPATLARSYESGGATCLSVLTDAEFFGGSPEDLAVARAACGLPVLRKDFTVSRLDVIDARIMGADAVLLIVAALDDAELVDLYGLARELSMDVLVEIHDEVELARALGVGVEMVGVNQRDLVTFEVDTQRAVQLAPRIPAEVIRVAESGIRGHDDAEILGAAGFDALLVGETLVTSADPTAMVTSLRVAR